MKKDKYGKIKKELNKDLKDTKITNQILKTTDKIILELTHNINHLLNLLDEETKTHSECVARLALLTGSTLDLTSSELEDLVIGALVHDIGKTSVPNEILMKPGKLTVEEMDEVKKHPKIGYELTRNLNLSKNVREIILDHHERIDGSGYPANKKAHQINYLAKIIAICDVFEAFSAKRCYKSAENLNVVMNFLIEEKDKQFDKTIVETFEKKVFPIILNYQNSKEVTTNEGLENIYISQPGYQNQ